MPRTKWITKKVYALINGKEVPGVLRMPRNDDKPKSIGRPHTSASREHPAWDNSAPLKPLRRPNRTRPINGG